MSNETLSSPGDDEEMTEGPGGAPPATFEFLVHTLFTQALMALGRILDEAQHQLRVLVLQATGSDPGKAGRV